jgi:hypothetical protein
MEFFELILVQKTSIINDQREYMFGVGFELTVISVESQLVIEKYMVLQQMLPLAWVHVCRLL